MAPNKPHHDAEESQISPGENSMITFKPRGLSIVWGEDERYWTLPTAGENAPAKLRQVCWLEVTGIAKLLVAGKYQVRFLLSKEQDAFGWNNCQPFLMNKVGKKGKYKWKKVVELNEDRKEEFSIVSEPIEVKDDEKDLYFGLYEVWSGKWKGGLCIHGAYVEKVHN